jgi:hypothetical protein
LLSVSWFLWGRGCLIQQFLGLFINQCFHFFQYSWISL